MSGVVIQRQTKSALLYWTGSTWSEDRCRAMVYEDATACPRILRLGGWSKAVRRITRYCAGSICWATVEDAGQVPAGGPKDAQRR